jgi:hypothetical protein
MLFKFYVQFLVEDMVSVIWLFIMDSLNWKFFGQPFLNFWYSSVFEYLAFTAISSASTNFGFRLRALLIISTVPLKSLWQAS